MERQSPKWALPHRQAHLVNLFIRSGGFCVFGHRPCPIPEHHYEAYIERLIEDWIADDKAQANAERQAEIRALHRLPERGALRGTFSAIGRDIFFGQQPQYYLEALGISGVTFRPFALVRLASSYVCLFVDLGDALKGLSKAKRRKAARYGKALPQEVQEKVDEACRRAVKHYLG